MAVHPLLTKPLGWRQEHVGDNTELGTVEFDLIARQVSSVIGIVGLLGPILRPLSYIPCYVAVLSEAQVQILSMWLTFFLSRSLFTLMFMTVVDHIGGPIF